MYNMHGLKGNTYIHIYSKVITTFSQCVIVVVYSKIVSWFRKYACQLTYVYAASKTRFRNESSDSTIYIFVS